MKLIEILQKMKVSDLKKEISKQNIKGYSKLKKAELIEIMTDRPDKFKYLLLQNMKQKKEILEDKVKLKEAKDKLKKLTAKKIPAKKAQKAEVIKPKPKREPMIPKIIKTKTGIITVKPKEESKPEPKLTEIEKIRERLKQIELKKGRFMNPDQKKELKKLLDERERLKQKELKLLKKKVEDLKAKDKLKPAPKKEAPKPAPKKETKELLNDEIMEIEDLIEKNKELLSKVYISRIGYTGGRRVRDINYLSYVNIRLQEGGLTPKQAKETSSYRLSQIKDLLKQLKNFKVGGGKENDKQFKIGELKVLVPIEPNKEEPKKEEPKKEAPKPAPKKETKELSKDEKQLQQLFINDARLKNKFKASKSPMISGLSPKERDTRSKIRIGIEKEIKENKFLIFELEEKMKLKKEADDIKKEKAKLKLFKLNVENFLKKPTEALLEFIDINIELMDELPESKQDKLDKAIDKFENKK